MLVSPIDRIIFLMEEIEILKSKLRPEDTGHIPQQLIHLRVVWKKSEEN